GGNAAELHFRHALDFVVVVEDHAAQAGDAEVLVQHVAGEDVGGGQVADGLAVLLHGGFQGGVGGAGQEDVQRRHAAFDVDVAQDHQIAGLFEQAGYFAAQAFE